MSGRDFQGDIDNKGNQGEEMLIRIFEKNGLFLRDVSGEHKHYDFILSFDELKDYNKHYSLKAFFREIYKNKMNKEIEDGFTIDSKNNLGYFNGKKYIFLETVNNGFILGLKNKLELLNNNSKERKGLNFIMMNF